MTDLTKLSRRQIRYALYRNRSGGPDPEHLAVLTHFASDLSKYKLSISDFPETWDVGVANPLELVSGHLLFPLQAKIEESLFDENGLLKE